MIGSAIDGRQVIQCAPSLKSMVLAVVVPAVIGIAAISAVPDALASPGQKCGTVGSDTRRITGCGS